MKCKVCGEEKIYAKGMCKHCYNKDYNQKNHDKRKKLSKKWYEENKERAKENMKKYNDNHRNEINTKNRNKYKNNDEYNKRIKKSSKKWRKQNPEYWKSVIKYDKKVACELINEHVAEMEEKGDDQHLTAKFMKEICQLKCEK